MLTHRCIGTIGYMGGIMAVPEEFCWSWGNLLLFTQEALCQPGEHIHPVRTKLSLHDYARNDLLTQMRGDWILMLDCDMSLEPDFCARMVRLFERNHLDVLTGLYSYKSPPNLPVAYLLNPATGRHEIIAEWDRTLPLIQIDSAGAGCLLIRRSVCERITSELKENPFDRYPGKGEDHSFFLRLGKLGIPAWIAQHAEADHLAYYGVRTSRDYVTVPGKQTFERLAL